MKYFILLVLSRLIQLIVYIVVGTLTPVVVLMFSIGKYLIFYPLVAANIGAAVAAIVAACLGEWYWAADFFFTGACAFLLSGLYAWLATTVDPDFFRRGRLRYDYYDY